MFMWRREKATFQRVGGGGVLDFKCVREKIGHAPKQLAMCFGEVQHKIGQEGSLARVWVLLLGFEVGVA